LINFRLGKSNIKLSTKMNNKINTEKISSIKRKLKL
jgi:hypothetical protein